ncbi:MAG: hypothetical protein INR73_11080 [Williamsia sp.]|nr:hypothetical protein [Williamsia sp.]
MKKLLLLLLLPFIHLKAQNVNCSFKEPQILINFGSGYVPDLNTEDPSDYQRVPRYCPTDGHYAYTAYTSDCFRGDWQTLTEDHTPGDVDGNMMLVNASPSSGAFLRTTIIGLKSNTMYELSLWMMNVCRPTDKCPFPLLPNITIMLQTAAGKTVAYLGTGELARLQSPEWKQYSTIFTAPASESALTLTMIDNSPGGCGNDFALDDIAFRECIITKPPPVPVASRTPPAKTNVKTPVKTPPAKTTAATPPPAKQQLPAPPPVIKQQPPPKTPPVVAKQQPAPVTKQQPPPQTPPVVKQSPPKTGPPVVKQQPPPKPPVVAKQTAPPKPVPKQSPPEPAKKDPQLSQVAKPQSAPPPDTPVVAKPRAPVLPPPPPALVTRSNQLIKQLDIEPGELHIDLYDNGTIDGDTVTIYHNNVLLVSHARLSQKPISFTIPIDAAHPHHELVMVADNLGSIPPNTSLMIINAGAKRYEVFISSTEQKNAKVIIDLKE